MLNHHTNDARDFDNDRDHERGLEQDYEAAQDQYEASTCAVCKDPETVNSYLEFSPFVDSGVGKVCEGCADDLSDEHYESGVLA